MIKGVDWCKAQVLNVDGLFWNAVFAENHHRRSLARQKLGLLRRYEFRCAWCGGKEDLTIDHKRSVAAWALKNGVSVSKARRNTSLFGECRILCVGCHLFKNVFLDKTMR